MGRGGTESVTTSVDELRKRVTVDAHTPGSNEHRNAKVGISGIPNDTISVDAHALSAVEKKEIENVDVFIPGSYRASGDNAVGVDRRRSNEQSAGEVKKK